jgi:hypothetical protein
MDDVAFRPAVALAKALRAGELATTPRASVDVSGSQGSNHLFQPQKVSGFLLSQAAGVAHSPSHG